MSTFTSTTSGIVLSLASQNPATIVSGATVTNTTGSHSGDGVYGSAAAAWMVTNYGSIASGTGSTSAAIALASGGTVLNKVAGHIDPLPFPLAAQAPFG